MTEIIVRYGCDGCGLLFEDKKDLKVVEVQQFRGNVNRGGIYTTDRHELLCEMCWEERQPANDYRRSGARL